MTSVVNEKRVFSSGPSWFMVGLETVLPWVALWGSDHILWAVKSWGFIWKGIRYYRSAYWGVLAGAAVGVGPRHSYRTV